MKKFLGLIVSYAVIVTNLFASPADKTNVWERATYGNLPGITKVNLMGYNPAIAATFEDASPESSLIAIPTAALTTPYCASTSANDTSAGTGARTLTVTVVNTSYTEVTETVTLNGTTSVNLATANVLGFNNVVVATAGSSGGNEGVIDCGVGVNTAGSAATAYVTIGVFSTSALQAAGAGGGNVSQVFQYIVPDNKTLICRNIQAMSVQATAAAAMSMVIDGITDGGVLKRFYTKFVHNTGDNPGGGPEIVKFPEKTYLKGKLAGISLTTLSGMSAECLLISTTDGAQSLF